MSVDRPIDQSSDAELYRGALSDEPPTAETAPTQEPQPEQPAESQQAQEPAAVTQPRDEHGRFAPLKPPTDQAPDAPAAATQQQPGEPAAQADLDTAIPPWRARELREQREAEATRARTLEAELSEMRRRYAAMDQQVRAQQQEPVQVPDLIADPQAYHQHVMQLLQQQEQSFRQEQRNTVANVSFQRAHDRAGELFEAAYGEMIQRAERGDRSIVQHVMASPDPGATMVNWFRREQTLQKVGDDPDAWFEKELRERAKDPKRAGAALEVLRGGGQPAPNGQQPTGVRTEFQIPPSLNRVAAAAPNTGDVTGDLTDASLFRYATR